MTSRGPAHDAWQGALSIFALLSVVTFAGINAYYFALFAELGVTPQEVGVTQSELLARALSPFTGLGAIVLVILVPVLAVVGFVRVIYYFRRRRTPLAIARLQRYKESLLLLGLAVLITLPMTLHIKGGVSAESMIGTRSRPIAVTVYTCLLSLFVWPSLRPFKWRRGQSNETDQRSSAISHRFVLVILVWLVSFCVYMNNLGTTDGKQLWSTGQIQLRPLLLGAPTLPVLPEFNQGAPPGYLPGQALVLLGSANGTSVLYNCRTHDIYRAREVRFSTLGEWDEHPPPVLCGLVPRAG